MVLYILLHAEYIFIVSQLLSLAFILPAIRAERQRPLPVFPPGTRPRPFRLYRRSVEPWTLTRVLSFAFSVLSLLAALNWVCAAFLVGLPSYRQRYGHDSAYSIYIHRHPGLLFITLTVALGVLFLAAWLGLQRRKRLYGPLPNPRRLRPFGFVVVLCSMLYVIQASELIFIVFHKM